MGEGPQRARMPDHAAGQDRPGEPTSSLEPPPDRVTLTQSRPPGHGPTHVQRRQITMPRSPSAPKDRPASPYDHLGYTPIHLCKEAYVLLSGMGGSFGDCVLVVPELYRALDEQSLDDLPRALLDELVQQQDGGLDDLDERIRRLHRCWKAMDSQELICLISNLECHLAHNRPSPTPSPSVPRQRWSHEAAPTLLTCAFTTTLSGMANHAREHGVTILSERFD